MEALTISAANLDTIEKNLGAVANELNGVINNVSTVNNQVNKVEAKVADLNDEVKGLVKEIRETTIISNARQSIMYNNTIIDKKYGYYDTVRRNTESLLDAINNSQISLNAVVNLKEEVLLNNPNYWLSNALAAIASWLLNDKESTDREVKNALSKDNTKTSLFFSLINLKLGRINSSINWLKRYLTYESPLELDQNFIVVLDLVATGTYGDEAKNLVFTKIEEWFNHLNSEKHIKDEQITIWQDFIKKYEDTDIKMSYLEVATPEINILKKNLAITSSYKNLLDYLNTMIYNTKSNKNIDEILNNLIYEYESNEQTYQKDNLRNNLIIECNGDRNKAEELFKKQEYIYNQKQDLITLLSNIVIYKDSYKVSNETQKIALSLIKEYIITAINENNKEINKDPFNIIIDKFQTKTTDAHNLDEVKNDLELHLHNQFDSDDKDLIIILLIVNILGIIGIFITLNHQVLSTILIIILVLGNIVLFLKLNRRNILRTKEKDKMRKNYLPLIEKIFAQTTDYLNMMKEDETHYNELLIFLNDLKPEHYLNSNKERNIEIED